MTKAPLLEVRNVSSTFKLRAGLMKPARILRAVNDVSLTVMPGENYGLVGESGSGKSTLLRIILGLIENYEGQVLVDGVELSKLNRVERARLVQPVFQDPNSSLNPRHTIADIIAQPLRIHAAESREEEQRQVRRLMDAVGLPKRCYEAYPSQLSGGQRQRVAVARALILNPKLVVCDEPTSALDVSVQAQILNLLDELQRDFSLTYLVVSHNLAVVEHVSAHVGVMYLGRIVEQATTDSLFAEPQHPYTKALLAAVLTPEVGFGIPKLGIGLSFPNPTQPPSGCTFHPRCGVATSTCKKESPQSEVVKAEHTVACWHSPASDVVPFRANR